MGSSGGTFPEEHPIRISLGIRRLRSRQRGGRAGRVQLSGQASRRAADSAGDRNPALARSAETQEVEACRAESELLALSAGVLQVAIGLSWNVIGLGADGAFEVLRAYARSQRRRLDEVAAQMVSGR